MDNAGETLPKHHDFLKFDQTLEFLKSTSTKYLQPLRREITCITFELSARTQRD